MWWLVGKSSCLWRLNKDPAETATLGRTENHVQLSGTEDLLSVLAGVWFLIVRPPDGISCLSIQQEGKMTVPDQVTVRTQEGGMNSYVERRCRQEWTVAFVLCWALGKLR